MVDRHNLIAAPIAEDVANFVNRLGDISPIGVVDYVEAFTGSMIGEIHLPKIAQTAQVGRSGVRSAARNRSSGPGCADGRVAQNLTTGDRGVRVAQQSAGAKPPVILPHSLFAPRYGHGFDAMAARLLSPRPVCRKRNQMESSDWVANRARVAAHVQHFGDETEENAFY
ncbi:MAG: hypothetical protein AAGM38_01535 [Pseudomonadota bacterium]